MEKTVANILDFFDTNDFVLDNVGTEYRGGILVVFYEDWYLPIDEVFRLINSGKRVSLGNFKK